MSSFSTIPLSQADPTLVRFLAREERAQAGAIALPACALERGEMISGAIGGGRAFAALVLDGMLLQPLRLGEHPGLRLFGPGDLLSLVATSHSTLLAAGTCKATSPTRLVLFEREILLAARRWPLLIAGLHARGAEQSNRLLAQMMICQIPRVDERVLALMWLLAERWGHITPAGMRLPVVLTHGTIGGLIGARRPTVTLAVGELVDRGALLRQDGSWLLLERPSGATAGPEPETRATDDPRVATVADSDWLVRPQPEPFADAVGPQLRAKVALLREQHERNLRELRERQAQMGDRRSSLRRRGDRSARGVSGQPAV